MSRWRGGRVCEGQSQHAFFFFVLAHDRTEFVKCQTAMLSAEMTGEQPAAVAQAAAGAEEERGMRGKEGKRAEASGAPWSGAL